MTANDAPERMNWDEPRLWSKVAADQSGCWLWTASLHSEGYGLFHWRCTTRGAHRVVYELLVGPIPTGLHIDHLCRVRHCVNPMHMEPVTSRENTLRGEGPSANGARATQCLRGHLFDAANTYRRRGSRHCRACRKQWLRDFRARVAN